MTTANAEQKTATITLRAGDNTMRLVATRRSDGSAITFVTTAKDGSKETMRGMTQQHPTFTEAKTGLNALASDAEGKGWTRKTTGRGFVAKPDAFTALPDAPEGPAKPNATPRVVRRK